MLANSSNPDAGMQTACVGPQPLGPAAGLIGSFSTSIVHLHL